MPRRRKELPVSSDAPQETEATAADTAAQAPESPSVDVGEPRRRTRAASPRKPAADTAAQAPESPSAVAGAPRRRTRAASPRKPAADTAAQAPESPSADAGAPGRGTRAASPRKPAANAAAQAPETPSADAGAPETAALTKEAAVMPPVASEAQTEAEAVLPAAEPANDAAPANVSASSSPADESGAGTQALGKDDGLQRLLGRRLKKKKRNETHEKDSVYIRKDLKERLAKLAANHGKGFRTLLLNYGLEKALDELEQADAALRQGEQL